MVKIAIVMTYYERQYQLNKTLHSIAKTNHADIEVIVVDDQSPTPVQIGFHDFPIHVIRTEAKCWTNPEPAYNTGLLKAMELNPDVIMLQNAECYHVGDVIAKAAMVDLHEHLTFACMSIDKATTFMAHDITAVCMANDISATYDGQTAWYNHSVKRPVAYDFCAAMRAENMMQLNGYDERFSSGCGYGDDNLLHRIRRMGLRVRIIDAPFVVHQWHYDLPTPWNKPELAAKNRELHHALKSESSVIARHLFTKNLYEHM